ncbi:MAG: alpha/beta hydrolase [Pseudomonadota bacterium]
MSAPMQTDYRDVEGMRMFFRTAGEGRPVLLLHAGLATGSLAWGRWFQPLSEHYRVIAPDIRGHGRTDNPAGRFVGFGPMAWDMLRFIEMLDLDEPPDVVGHSCGAIIALHMAVYEPDHIGRVALLGAQPFIGRSDRYAEALREHFSCKDLDVVPNPLRFFRNNPTTGATLTLAHRQTSPWQLFGQLWHMRVRPLTLDESDFAKVKNPMLLMIGDADPFVSLDETEALATLVPGTRMVKLPGHDHYSALKDTAVVTGTVEPFLGEAPHG